MSGAGVILGLALQTVAWGDGSPPVAAPAGSQLRLRAPAYLVDDVVMVGAEPLLDWVGANHHLVVPGPPFYDPQLMVNAVVDGTEVGIAVWVNGTLALIGDRPVRMPATAVQGDGVVMVPLRVLTDALGIDAHWDPVSGRAMLRHKGREAMLVVNPWPSLWGTDFAAPRSWWRLPDTPGARAPFVHTLAFSTHGDRGFVGLMSIGPEKWRENKSGDDLDADSAIAQVARALGVVAMDEQRWQAESRHSVETQWRAAGIRTGRRLRLTGRPTDARRPVVLDVRVGESFDGWLFGLILATTDQAAADQVELVLAATTFGRGAEPGGTP